MNNISSTDGAKEDQRRDRGDLLVSVHRRVVASILRNGEIIARVPKLAGFDQRAFGNQVL
jgi:hypothetical protein